MGRDAKEVKVLLMLPFTRKAPAPPSPKSKESVTLRVETEARCMSECVKLGLAVWLWASHFPCLGLSDLLGYMGTIIAVSLPDNGAALPTSPHSSGSLSRGRRPTLQVSPPGQLAGSVSLCVSLCLLSPPLCLCKCVFLSLSFCLCVCLFHHF